MEKNFDAWNTIKKQINNEHLILYCNPKDIWWSSIGLNVGSEEDGKHELFERPVLIIKVFNKDMARVIPLTSKIRNDKNHCTISYNNRLGSAILSQMKTISTKRLSRKLGKLDQKQFNFVVKKLFEELL